MSISLKRYGWNEFVAQAFQSLERTADLVPGRIAIQHRGAFTVYTEFGDIRAHAAGRMRHEAMDVGAMPAVGDWVALRSPEHSGAGIIEAVLPRKSSFLRKMTGTKSVQQVIAANIDVAFLVNGLDADFNVRRIERYLVLSKESGAQSVIILNKVDLCESLDEVVDVVRSVGGDTPVHVMSALHESGMEVFQKYLPPGTTGVLLGSSGVGKSTIMNVLLGEKKQEVKEVRDSDGEGRHTTSSRELILLPFGGLLIDTPGMRELQLWGDSESLSDAFTDIEELALECRFRDCSHAVEPGCAIQRAIGEGRLDQDRYDHFLKLQKEIAYLERRRDVRAQLDEKKRVKKLTSKQKRSPKRR